MRPRDSIILAHFLQVYLEAQRQLSSCQEIHDEFTLAMLQLLEPPQRLALETMTNALVLHQHRLSCVFMLLNSTELGDWVHARSTTWYSDFLMTQFNRQRWIEHFRVTREVVQQLTERLRPLVSKKDTRYRFAIPVGIRVACSLYKLARGADYLQCSEMFAIGKSTVHLVLHEFVCAINEVFKNQMRWPAGADLDSVMSGFKTFCGLPSVHGAIDVAQIHIQKPQGAFAADYYSFKSKGHSLQLQAVVDHQKRFREVFVGMPGSVNDARVLRLSALYQKALFDGLFDLERGSQDGVHPYILGDKGYPLLPWLMIPHKQGANVQHTVLEALFNRHLCRGRSVVENAFGILKKTFRELLLKSGLDIHFLPDVVVCCCLLHNMILDGKDVDVEALMSQLDQEDHGPTQRPPRQQPHGGDGNAGADAEPGLEGDEISGTEQREILETYLGNRRPIRV